MFKVCLGSDTKLPINVDPETFDEESRKFRKLRGFRRSAGTVPEDAKDKDEARRQEQVAIAHQLMQNLGKHSRIVFKEVVVLVCGTEVRSSLRSRKG